MDKKYENISNMKKNDLLEVIELAQTPKAFEYANEIMSAYETLDKMDSPEFANLKFDYLRGEVEPPLKDVFEDYLLFNQEQLKNVGELQKLLYVVKHRYPDIIKNASQKDLEDISNESDDKNQKDEPTSKPGKKTIIPTILLAGMLGYNTIGDKVISEYQNTTQPQAQVEVANEDYKASALEKLTNALAPNKAHAGSNQDYERPDDATLKEWMSQPVEETLAGTNYTKVNDNNYKKEVKKADQPVMVLFHADPKDTTNTGGQSGLVALARTLHEKFPEIKLCAYQHTDKKSITPSQLEELQEDYPLETAPALLFYEEKDNESGTKNMGKNWHLQGGIKTLGFLQDKIDAYNQYIPKRLVD